MHKKEKYTIKNTKFTGYLLHSDFLQKEIEENLEIIQKFNKLNTEYKRKENKYE
jgi:hypothetical protein